MKRHIPGPAKGRYRLQTYCGIPYDGKQSPDVVRGGVLLAAMGGMLRLYCRSCLAHALAGSFAAIQAGAQGARKAHSHRTQAERQELGLKAADARWKPLRERLSHAQAMRLGMAPDAE